MEHELLTKNHKNHIDIGKNKLIENIKILLYKKDPNIFDTLNFENNEIYQEPLLFAYFNSTNRKNKNIFDNVNRESLNTLVYGYKEHELRPIAIQVKSDEFGRIYLPNWGWLVTQKNKQFELVKNENQKIKLISEGIECDFKFEQLDIITGSKIELLKYPISILKRFYYDVDLNLVEVDIENISAKHKKNLTKALNLIKQLVPYHYELIEMVTKKIVIFNVDTTLRNSFAAINAQGIAFFNACQEDYNEVFFVDDIAHQTGHIIFNALVYDLSDFIKINPNTVLESIELANNTRENRNIHTVFHGLYTYFTTFICLGACLDAKVFKHEKEHEALGRMYFYIGKCYQDLKLIENAKIDSSIGAQGIFTQKGLEIYSDIKNKFKFIADKWLPIVKHYNLDNQPYNFSYSYFVKLNPLHENNY